MEVVPQFQVCITRTALPSSLYLKTLINQKVFLRTTFGILTSGSESVTVNGQERFGTFNKLVIIFHKDKSVIIRIMRRDRLC